MRGPPERESPARTGILPGSKAHTGGGLHETTYTDLAEKETAVCEAADDDADYLTRWGPYFEGEKQDGYAATLLPSHGDWARLEVAPTWWQAMALAIEWADQTPRCVYMGGSQGGAA